MEEMDAETRRQYLVEFDRQHRWAMMHFLSELTQTTTVASFQAAFEELLDGVTRISESLLITFFIFGLRPEIRRELRYLPTPFTLREAFVLAKTGEARATHSTNSGSLSTPPKTTPRLSVSLSPDPLPKPSPDPSIYSPFNQFPTIQSLSLDAPLKTIIFPNPLPSILHSSTGSFPNLFPLSTPPPEPPDPDPRNKREDESGLEPDLNLKTDAKPERKSSRSASPTVARRRCPTNLFKQRYELYFGIQNIVGLHDFVATGVEYLDGAGQVIKAGLGKKWRIWDPGLTFECKECKSVDSKVWAMPLCGVYLPAAVGVVIGNRFFIIWIRDKIDPTSLIYNIFLLDFSLSMKKEVANRVIEGMKMQGLEHDIVMSKELLNSGVRVKKADDAEEVFAEMPHKSYRTCIHLTSFIIVAVFIGSTGLQASKTIESLSRVMMQYGFESIHFVGSALLDVYAKGGNVIDSYMVFVELNRPNFVSCQGMIAAFMLNGLFGELLVLLEQMWVFETVPNSVTLTEISHNYMGYGSLELWKSVQTYIDKVGISSHVSVIVDAYDLRNSKGPAQAQDCSVDYQTLCVLSFSDLQGFGVGFIVGRGALKFLSHKLKARNYHLAAMNDTTFHPHLNIFVTKDNEGYAIIWCAQVHGEAPHNFQGAVEAVKIMVVIAKALAHQDHDTSDRVCVRNNHFEGMLQWADIVTMVDAKLQEIISKAAELLPELWKQAGHNHEAFYCYRLALLSHWHLDDECCIRIQKMFVVILLYGGVEAALPSWVVQATPKSQYAGMSQFVGELKIRSPYLIPPPKIQRSTGHLFTSMEVYVEVRAGSGIPRKVQTQIKGVENVFDEMLRKTTESFSTMDYGFANNVFCSAFLEFNSQQMRACDNVPNSISLLIFSHHCIGYGSLERCKNGHAHMVKAGLNSQVPVLIVVLEMCWSLGICKLKIRSVYVRNLITGTQQMDRAILVTSGIAGYRCMFINKQNHFKDEELFHFDEFLSSYDFPEDDVPIIPTSVWFILKALKAKVNIKQRVDPWLYKIYDRCCVSLRSENTVTCFQSLVG